MKLKTFKHSLINTFSNPQYGNDIIQAKKGFSMKFFTMMVFSISLIMSIFSAIIIAQFSPSNFAQSALNYIPTDFELKVQSGAWEINQPLPYKIGENIDFASLGLDSSFNSIIQFDTNQNIKNDKDFRLSKAIFLLTEDSFYTYQNLETGQVQVTDIGPTNASNELNNETFTFNYSIAKMFTDQLLGNPFIAQKLYVPALGVSILIIVFIFMWTFTLLGLLIYDLVIMLIAKIALPSQKGITYNQIFQISLHSIWPIKLVELLLQSFNIYLPGSISFIIFAVWTIILIKNIKNLNPTSESETLKQTPTKKKAIPSTSTTNKTPKTPTKSSK